MKISVLIPYKPDGGRERDINFSFVKKRYETRMPDVELVVGEDNSEPFNRSKAINLAAAKATGNLLLLADGDVFFGTKLIDKILAIAGLHPWIVPFSRGYKLTLEGTREVTKTGELQLPSNLVNAGIEKNCDNLGAFMNVISRQAFETIGGMDERFLGWGREDESMAKALDTLVGKHFRMDETIFHLWHPPADCHPHYLARNDEHRDKYIQAFGNPQAMKELITGGRISEQYQNQ
jgi:predicted glycosyltransferase involved in capsule biosynthesis